MDNLNKTMLTEAICSTEMFAWANPKKNITRDIYKKEGKLFPRCTCLQGTTSK